MQPPKHLAGNDTAIFLFRFGLNGNGIEFGLNEGIAADMYDDVDEHAVRERALLGACSGYV